MEKGDTRKLTDRYKDPNILGEIQRQPMHLRAYITPNLLSKYPQYKELFHKCPSCGKFSLKPVMHPSNFTPESIKNVKKRKCTLCGYIHDTETSTVYGWS
jgi:rubredoxin